MSTGIARDGSPALRSCLYVGWVRHRRFGPAANAFRYRMVQPMLDLAELDEVFHGRLLWSTRRPSWVWFRRADHLGDPDRPLEACVRELVLERLGRRPAGGIRLLTHPRYLGYVMNPVSFYYCDDEAGTLDAIVAEVHNTPWGERHCYVLDVAAARAAAGGRRRGAWRFDFDKAFHVSPFLPMDQRYVWRFSEPGERLLVHMENHPRTSAAGSSGDGGRAGAGRRPFDATLVMSRRPITGASLARVLAAHPVMTGMVIARIYWQALRLWTKGARFHPHPRRLAETAP